MWYLSISGTELLKPSDFHDKRLSATPEFTLMKWIWKALKDGGWLPGEPILNRELELLVPPSDLRERERSWRFNGQWFHQSFLCNEVFLKTTKKEIQRTSGLVNTWRFGESMEAPCPFLVPCLLHLFHLAVPELSPFIINQRSSKQNVSLSSELL